jgi:hypothetical protein
LVNDADFAKVFRVRPNCSVGSAVNSHGVGI